MSDKKILFVIGAGASSEARMPTGYGLRKNIIDLLDMQLNEIMHDISGDAFITQAIKLHLKKQDVLMASIKYYYRAAHLIRNAMPQAISIDNFLDVHKGDEKIELCGKLAIVRSILNAEEDSLLYFYGVDGSLGCQPIDFEILESTWYNRFMQLITENCPFVDLENRLKSITLIIFNYDRCVEHFLYYSFQNFYGIDKVKAAELVNKINIYHPYGIVGHLPWQKKEGSVAFGGLPNANIILDLAGQIKTFTEGTDPSSSEIKEIRQKIIEADQVVFLGFAFHKLNMKLIRPVNYMSDTVSDTVYFGTAMGISDSDSELIKKELHVLCKGGTTGINIRNDLTCYKLFGEYWRSLSFS